MRRLAIIALAALLTLTTMEGCSPMSTKPDLSYVKEGLVVPSSFEEIDMLGGEADIAAEKGLVKDGDVVINGVETHRADEYFLTLQAYYRKAYEQYLLITLRLDVYDGQIEDAGLDFIPTPEDRLDVYQEQTNLSLRHLYVRNDIHIEYLTQEDADLLRRLHGDNGDVITQEALDLVERTYPEVIMMRSPFGLEPYPDGVNVLLSDAGVNCDPRSILIVFTTPYRYDESGNYPPGEVEQAKRRKEYLLSHLPEIRREMQEKVGVPVTLVTVERRGYYQYTIDDQIRYGTHLYVPPVE